MATTDFIAAIELSSSKISGIAGKKNSDGSIQVLAYACEDALNQDLVDTRFDMVTRGSAPYVEWLGQQENPNGGGWAAGSNYGEKLRKLLSDLKAE